jgi:5'-3' exonuclease
LIFCRNNSRIFTNLKTIEEVTLIESNDEDEEVLLTERKRFVETSIIHSPNPNISKERIELEEQESLLDESILRVIEQSCKRLKTDSTLKSTEKTSNTMDPKEFTTTQAVCDDFDQSFLNQSGLVFMRETEVKTPIEPEKEMPQETEAELPIEHELQTSQEPKVETPIELETKTLDCSNLVQEIPSEVQSPNVEPSSSSDSNVSLAELEDTPQTPRIAAIFLNNGKDKQIMVESPKKTASKPVIQKATENDKFAQEIDQELLDLRNEIKKVNRQTNTVQKRMIDEIKELLELFGIPYVVSPMEAEAQCAALEMQQLTQGTITEDSDMWLFGARTVYKNFFNQSKFVLKYSSERIEQQFKLTRENLICLAMLCGSDYTDGVRNIGPITAVEIISEFQGSHLEPLIRFRDWWTSRKDGKFEKGNKTRNKFMKYDLPPSFPMTQVYKAYHNPVVHQQTHKFQFGRPDLDLLRKYAFDKLGWSKERSDKELLPMFQRLKETQTQMRLHNFFSVIKKQEVPSGSNRLNKAVKKMNNEMSPEVTKKDKKIGKGREKKKEPSLDLLPSLKTRVRNQKLVRTTGRQNKKGADQVQTRLSGIFQKVSEVVDLSGDESDD